MIFGINTLKASGQHLKVIHYIKNCLFYVNKNCLFYVSIVNEKNKNIS